MIVHDLLEKGDDELIGMLKSIQNEPIEWTPVVLAELTRRSIVRLLETSRRLESSSNRLENLTRWLISLTIVLFFVALPPAIDALKQWFHKG